MKKMRSSGVLGILMAAGALAACGGGAGGKAGANSPGQVVPPTGGACTSTSSADNAQPMTQATASSTLALAKISGRSVALVADEDAHSILTFDLETQRQIAETHLTGTPNQLLVATDGRVFVTLRDKSELLVLSASRSDAPLTQLCSAQTAAEPIAIAPTPDGATIVVTTGWGQRLMAFDAATLASRFEAKLPREPRGVVVSDDGKRAFVSHAVGSLVSTVDLTGAKHEVTAITMRGLDPQSELVTQMREKKGTGGSATFSAITDRPEPGRPSCQGFTLAKSSAVAGRIFAPHVLVDPGDFEQRPDGYGDDGTETEAPAVAVLDEGTATPITASMLITHELPMFRKSRGGDARDGRPQCLLPRASAIDPKTRSVLVTCYGIDAVIAYDATAANPMLAERRRWIVGSGPSGVAVDPGTHRAVVWSQFDRTLSTFPIGESELVDEKASPLKVQKTAAGPLTTKVPTEYALGRILFHAAGDARVSADGRACASCHPDGRDDAITWATPEGPRRSIMLAGRAMASAPYSWNGDEMTLHNHLGNTFDRLSGKGLRSIELDALVTYIAQMPAPQQVTPSPEKAKVERGRAIFASKEAACSSCHAGANFTDGRNHDVGSKHKADRAGSFNTPSLHLVGGTGPYFHDGRYATLTDLLRKTDGQMGHTKHLSNADLDSLETYLRTL